MPEDCRQHHLASRRRAVHNLAWALREEGDIAGSAPAASTSRTRPTSPAGYGLATSFADEAGRAYFAGDWDRYARRGDRRHPGGQAEWDLGAITLFAWVRVLRGEESSPTTWTRPSPAARRSGFRRVLRAALANAALCRALQGRAEEAHELLAAVEQDWLATRMLAFGEWTAAASHAAAVLGPTASNQVRRMLERAPHRTPWVHAGLATVAGALTDDPVQAAAHHTEAARIYAKIGNASDRMLALAASARSLWPPGTPAPPRSWPR